MVATKYTYSLATDFGGNIHITNLFDEIDASSITTAVDATQTVVHGDVVDLWFVDALTAGEKTTLDNDASPAEGLIAAHDATPKDPPEMVTADYTANINDTVILVDATSGAVTISLPAASTMTGIVLTVIKTDSSLNVVTIDPNASETVNGNTTEVLGGQAATIQIECDGSNWILTSTVFGNDFQYEENVGRTTTTSSTYQTKETLVTPALKGTYRIEFSAYVDNSVAGNQTQVRFRNDTDGTNPVATIPISTSNTADRTPVCVSFEYVFTGVAKTFKIQYRDLDGSTAGIKEARIQLWRVR